MPSEKRKSLKSYRIESTRDELPSQFLPGDVCNEALQAALNRYADSGKSGDRDAIVALFLPKITAMAINRKQSASTPVQNEVDDFISDGCLAVMGVVSRHADLPWERFRMIATSAIRCSFNAGMAERTWAGGVRRGARQNHTMLAIRSVFLKQHGRMPKGVEIRAALDQMIKNGQIEKEFTRPRMNAASAVADEDGVDLLAQLGEDRSPAPLYEIISRETMQLAMKGLTGMDRRLFKLSIEGFNANQIAKRVGLSNATVYNRVNGLLWAARCNADLAERGGYEADAAPPPLNKRGLNQSFNPLPARRVG
jgi:DNA-directed RNA polymerase specialized sigma subunit